MDFGNTLPKEPHVSKQSYKLSYFEDCRCSQNRSILGVCEDFENEQDAKRANLDGYCIIV